MDFGDDKKRGILPPASLSYSGNDDNISADDLAWADSCLIGDHELPEGGLNSFRNAFALLEIHSSRLNSSVDGNMEFLDTPNKKKSLITRKGKSSVVLDKTTYNSPENGIDNHRVSKSTDTFGSRFNSENAFLPTYNENQRIFIIEDSEMDSIFPAFLEDQPVLDEETTYNIPENEQEERNGVDYHKISESNDTFGSRFNSENVFLPTYNENQRIFLTDDPEVDSILPEFMEDNQPAENIFKVWELDIPDEEDELIGQVKKALAESSSLNDQLVDDLISGIADLSLSQKSG